MARSRLRRQFVLLFALLSVAALAGPSASAVATARPLDVISTVTSSPVLTGAVCTGGSPGILMVIGEEFTPGGAVDVVLTEAGNPNPAVIRSVRASLSFFGPNGSADPALGFEHGGFVGIALGHECEERAMVRAYDRQPATWSNQLPVEIGRASAR